MEFSLRLASVEFTLTGIHMLHRRLPPLGGVACLSPIALAALICPLPARAEDPPSLVQVAPPPAVDSFHELETKYIFGFTEGSDIEAEGEKAIEFETTGAFGMRGGSFTAIELECTRRSNNPSLKRPGIPVAQPE